MNIIHKSNFEQYRKDVIQSMLKGGIIIYPTDTIYGVGCNATDDDCVARLRELKKRPEEPFLVIAPSKEWIKENCLVKSEKELSKLPGPYNYILFKKESDSVSTFINPKGNSIGIRMLDHWFQDVVTEAGIPFVTTSVNISGEPNMTKLDEIPRELLENADYVIYDGEINGKQSESIDLTK